MCHEEFATHDARRLKKLMQKLPHIGLKIGEAAPDVVVVGDPGRAEHAARWLDDVVLMADRREFRSFYGRFQDIPITIMSHGIGAPGAAIAFEELIVAGAKRIVRAGTCGGLHPDVDSGGIVVAAGAVQNTGYGAQTVPDGYPAVADARLMLALQAAARAQGTAVHTGLVLSSDSFYPGIQSRRPHYADMAEANVLAVEMECAALFIIGSLRGVQTAAILAADGNVLHGGEQIDSYQPEDERVTAAVDAEIGIALHALWQLRQDEFE